MSKVMLEVLFSLLVMPMWSRHIFFIFLGSHIFERRKNFFCFLDLDVLGIRQFIYIFLLGSYVLGIRQYCYLPLFLRLCCH